MPANYVLIERIELNASTASITFANIPQSGYTDLKIIQSSRGSVTDSSDPYDLILTLNSTSTISSKVLRGDGTTVASNSITDRILRGGPVPSNWTANTFSNTEIYIPNYTGSQYKSWSSDAVQEKNATSTGMSMVAGLTSITAAITSITMASLVGSFVQYSTFSLYGLAASDTSPTLAPQATGGNIITTDGTYWYHAFLTSGTFTPLGSLSCDALVVAGGGGGGGNSGGGGGAGGYRTTTGLSLTSTAYTVTIGGGGTGSAAEANSGTSGSNSVFSTVTSTGGGFGAGYSTAGGNGGSGGGGNEVPSTSGGSGNTPSTSPSQGNNGAAGSSGSGRGGGGGGASTAGSAKDGGTGSYTSISGGATTGLGQLSSGNYYFAGGAGAGGAGVSGVGGLGGGGTGCAGTGSTQTAGTANTGGGGGGGGNSDRTGRAGGSGIVVVRYAV